jgi:hypothetical protein
MTPNPGINRSAQRRRRWVPVALRTPAPGYAQRWVARKRQARDGYEHVQWTDEVIQ